MLEKISIASNIAGKEQAVLRMQEGNLRSKGAELLGSPTALDDVFVVPFGQYPNTKSLSLRTSCDRKISRLQRAVREVQQSRRNAIVLRKRERRAKVKIWRCLFMDVASFGVVVFVI